MLETRRIGGHHIPVSATSVDRPGECGQGGRYVSEHCMSPGQLHWGNGLSGETYSTRIQQFMLLILEASS